MRTTKTILLTLAAGIAFAGVSFAESAPAQSQADFAPLREKIRERFQETFQQFGVTDAQKEQGREVMKKRWPEIKPLVQDLIEGKRALHQAVLQDPPNESVIRGQAQKLAQAEADLAVKMAWLRHDLRQIATPEQLEKIDTIRDFIRGRIGNRVDGFLGNFEKEMGL